MLLFADSITDLISTLGLPQWVAIAVAILITVIRGGTFGPAVDGILTMLQNLLKRPTVAALVESKVEVEKAPLLEKLSHSHDLDTVDGLVCSVECLVDKLKTIGKGDVGDAVMDSLAALVTSHVRKGSASGHADTK